MKKRIIRLTLVLILFLNVWIISISRGRIVEAGGVDLRKLPWKVTFNGEYKGEVSGPMAVREMKLWMDAGDELIYEVELPDCGEMAFPTLQIQTHGSGCEIYLDDRLVLEEDEGASGLSNIRRQHLHSITLPVDYIGKTLVIKIKTSQPIYREPLDMAAIGDYVELKNIFIRRYFSAFAIGILLMVMGIVMLMVSLILTARNVSMRINIFTALLCLDCGLLIHCKYSLPLIYSPSGRFQLAYSVTLFLLIPIISCSLFALEALKKTKGEILVLTGATLIGAAAFFLQITGVIIVETAINIHWLMLVILLVLIYRMQFRAGRMNENREQTIYQLAGLRILVEFLIVAVCYCEWHDARHIFGTGLGEVIYSNILLAGPLFYAYYQMLIFFESMSDSFARNREYAFLSHLAYEDGLTKLPNRSRIDAYLSHLEASRTDYCIISLDLDGLKKVNDTFGHWAGDKLLCTYGQVLDRVFGKDHFCGRIGGDEFMAVLTGVDAAKTDAILRKLQDELDALNLAEEDPWDYSCAAGYAFSHECKENHVHNTYLLADQRMYRQKEEHHKAALH